MVNSRSDHAQLFLMSPFIWTLDPEGANLLAISSFHPQGAKQVEAMFPNWDKHRMQGSLYRSAATNIYRCKDGSFFTFMVGLPDHHGRVLWY